VNTFRFSVFLAFSTFVLLGVGGTVNPSGSSLACPDWPTCYGSFFPEMTDGVEFEHTHRVVAALVGLLTIILAVMVWRTRTDRTVRWLSILAVGLVGFQGLLGGLTVIFELPPAISMTHLAISMAFFCFLIFLCFRLWPGRTPDGTIVPHEVVTAPRLWAGIALGAVYVQILLGGLVRHSSSGPACGTEIPLCQGSLWPSAWQGQIHMVHRYGGILVACIVLWAAFNVVRHAKKHKKTLAFQAALVAPLIVLVQVGLGVLTVITWIGLWEAVAHLAVGALLLANWAVIWFALGPQVDRVAEPTTRMEALAV